MPALGMAMSEATLLRWLRQPGDEVAAGEPVAEIETDKTAMELESPASGVLGVWLVAEGSTVPVGERLCTIIEAGDEVGVAENAAAVSSTATPATDIPEAPPPLVSSSSTVLAESEESNTWRTPHRESPRARRAARETAAAGQSDEPIASTATDATRATTPLPGRHRALIAAKVSQSWREIPHFAVVREIDADALVRAREDVRSVVPDATLTDLLLRALARALYETGMPEPVNVGLAVDTPLGVAIPIVTDVLGRSLQALAATRADVVGRAVSGHLLPADVEAQATSTLSNLGGFGVDAFTGVIYPGQTSLLTVGRVASRAIVEDGAVIARTTVIATLNVDHRVLDGADAARLLGSFAASIERPAGLTDGDAA